MTANDEIRARLEYLRGELRAERISQGELLELQGLAEHIEPGDVELLEPAGIPEHWQETNIAPWGEEGSFQYDTDGKPRIEIATCGHCGRSWNDALITSRTPVPSGRCPFEYEHEYPDEGEAMSNKTEDRAGLPLARLQALANHYSVDINAPGTGYDERNRYISVVGWQTRQGEGASYEYSFDGWDDIDSAFTHIGDMVLEGYVPERIYDLTTGEAIELHVSTPIVTRSTEQVATMENPLEGVTEPAWTVGEYQDALNTAAELLQETIRNPEEGHPEYARGVVELLADLFGRPGVYLSDRKAEVARDLGIDPNRL